MPNIIKKKKNIAEFFGRNEEWLRRKLPELRDAGAVFYMWHGRPKQRVLCAWDTVLIAWTIEKQSKGETI